MWIEDSPLEKTPFWLRWRGRYRRRVSKTVWLFGIVAVSHKRVWKYYA